MKTLKLIVIIFLFFNVTNCGKIGPLKLPKQEEPKETSEPSNNNTSPNQP